MSAVALALVWDSGLATHSGEAGPVVDDVAAAALIRAWSAAQTPALVASIRHSGALQRYVRGSRT
jgi:hypothetical protein